MEKLYKQNKRTIEVDQCFIFFCIFFSQLMKNGLVRSIHTYTRLTKLLSQFEVHYRLSKTWVLLVFGQCEAIILHFTTIIAVFIWQSHPSGAEKWRNMTSSNLGSVVTKAYEVPCSSSLFTNSLSHNNFSDLWWWKALISCHKYLLDANSLCFSHSG